MGLGDLLLSAKVSEEAASELFTEGEFAEGGLRVLGGVFRIGLTIELVGGGPELPDEVEGLGLHAILYKFDWGY